MTNIHYRAVSWDEKKDQLRLIRTRVFIEEQHVPIELEWDDADKDAQHYLVSLNEAPIACARILPSGQIGRMAVLSAFRNNGIGGNLLKKITQVAQAQGSAPVFLHAQNHAIPFYEKFGFSIQGEEFMDAGIPHHEMVYRKQGIN